MRPLRAYRRARAAFRVFNTMRKRRRGEHLELEEEEIMGALKSKTVWAGVLMAAWGGAVLPFLNAGDFSREAIVSLVFGVVTIALRFVTNKPLSEK